MSTGSNEGTQIDGAPRVEQAVSAPASVDSQAVTTPARGGIRTTLGTLLSYIPGFGKKNAAPADPDPAQEHEMAAAVPQAVEAAPESELGTEEWLVEYEAGKWNPGVASSLMFRAAVDAGMKTTEARDPNRLNVIVDAAANQVRVVIVASQAVRERLFEHLSAPRSQNGDAAKVSKVGAANLVAFPTLAEDGADQESATA